MGPSDLGLSLGYAPGNHDEPVLLEAIETILIKTNSNGKLFDNSSSEVFKTFKHQMVSKKLLLKISTPAYYKGSLVL